MLRFPVPDSYEFLGDSEWQVAVQHAPRGELVDYLLEAACRVVSLVETTAARAWSRAAARARSCERGEAGGEAGGEAEGGSRRLNEAMCGKRPTLKVELSRTKGGLSLIHI